MFRLIRWGVILLILLVVVGFVGCARGREHRRGDDVGALGGGIPPAARVA